MLKRWKLGLSVACSCAVLLAACGGGGGDGAGSGTVPTPTLARLNDTGVSADQCFAAGSNTFMACSSSQARALSTTQDGQLGRDAVAGTNSSTDGKLGFQFSAVAGGCVRDEVTGLVWESKTADGGLRDNTRAYPNYGDGRSGDASEFVSAVNLAGLCGAADWRLPTFAELGGLVDYGAMAAGSRPWIDTTWLPNTPAAHYWTSDLITPMFGVNSRVRWVQFNPRGFFIQPGDRSELYGVRLVRGGNALVPTATRFTPSPDAQEVTDGQTGLVWRRCAEGTTFAAGSCTGTITILSHEQALSLASARAALTGAGWRLPNAKELASLAQPSGGSPARALVAFPSTPTGYLSSVWAATPCSTGAAAYAGTDFAVHCLARELGAAAQLVRDPL